MQPSRNLLWFVIVGLVVIGGLYYFFEGEGKPPAKAPAVTESAAPPPVAEPSTAAPAAEPTSSEPSPADATANDAAETAKRIEEDQRKQEMMMEKPSMPEDMNKESMDKKDAAPKE